MCVYEDWIGVICTSDDCGNLIYKRRKENEIEN